MENEVLDLETQIKNALPQGVKIENCKESQFLKTYTFSTKKDSETITANIKFYYNAKSKVTRIYIDTDSEFGKLLVENFSHITDLYYQVNNNNETIKTLIYYEFPRESLKDLFEVLKDRLNKESIIIKGYPQDFPYRQRYTFQKDNLIAIFDFIYNESGEITNVTNMPNDCDSSEFVERLKAIFAEIFNNNEIDDE